MFVGYDDEVGLDELFTVNDTNQNEVNIASLYEVVVLDGLTVVLRMEGVDEQVVLIALWLEDEVEVDTVEGEEALEAQQAILELDSNVKELDEDEVLVVIDVPEVTHIRILFVDETDEIELHTPLNEPVRIMLEVVVDDEARVDEQIVMVDEDEVEVVLVRQQVLALVEVEVEGLVIKQHLVLELDDYLCLGIQQLVTTI